MHYRTTLKNEMTYHRQRCCSLGIVVRQRIAFGRLGEWPHDHPPAFKTGREPFRLIRLLDSTSRRWRPRLGLALCRLLLGPCHGYLQGAALVGTIARRLGIV